MLSIYLGNLHTIIADRHSKLFAKKGVVYSNLKQGPIYFQFKFTKLISDCSNLNCLSDPVCTE